MSPNAKLVHRWFREVWCHDDSGEDAIDALMSNDAQFHGIGDAPQGRDAFKQLRRQILRRIPDIQISPVDIVELGDHVAFSARLSGTHKESGQPVALTGTAFGRVENGQFVSAHQSWDFLSLFVQTGKVDASAVTKEFGDV